jgi:hypothetical protein
MASVALANCRRSGSNLPEASSGTVTPADRSQEPLHIYTWADYANDEV